MIASPLPALPEPEAGPANGPVIGAILPAPRAPALPAAAARAVLARCAAAVAATVLLAGVSAASEEPATAPVETLHGALIETMKAGGARRDAASRARSLEPVVHRVFDLERLARVALGPHWNTLDSGQRARMVDVVSRYTAASYAARFDGYSGERFETTGTRPLRRGRVLVRTLLHPPGGEPVRLDYVVQPRGGWRIVNVVANGVSELALRRAEYDAVMAAEGFDELVGRLERQIADLMADSR